MHMTPRTIPYLIGALLFTFLGYVIWEDCFQWPAYRDTHHCALTGKQHLKNTVQTVTSIGPNGQAHTTVVPSVRVEDEWLCDGSERIWR